MTGNGEKKNYASDSTHWYDKDGQPRYTYTNKKGETKPTTWREAKKHGWVPSVTTVLKVMAAPGLENWKQDQVLMSAATMPHDNLTDEEWRKAVKQEAKEKAIAAAERGTQFHADIERWLQGQTTSCLETCELISMRLKGIGIDLAMGRAEHSFAHELGFGGKVDWHNAFAVVDFKTKDVLGDKTDKELAYDEHRCQLAAYAHGLGLWPVRCVNVFVGIDDGKVVVAEHSMEDLERAWSKFYHALAIWKLDHGLK